MRHIKEIDADFERIGERSCAVKALWDLVSKEYCKQEALLEMCNTPVWKYMRKLKQDPECFVEIDMRHLSSC